MDSSGSEVHGFERTPRAGVEERKMAGPRGQFNPAEQQPGQPS